MFHVKICGVTTPADARAAVEAGADAIGLNFVEGSPRKLDPSHAMNVSKALPVGVVRVGVFADCSSEEILRIVRSVGLDAVQLHGNEPPEILDAFARAAVPVIRSARLSQGPIRWKKFVNGSSGRRGLACNQRWCLWTPLSQANSAVPELR